MEARLRNVCCHVKAMRIAYSECVSVALGIHYAVHMRRIILSPVAYLVLQYFSTLSPKQHDFREKKLFDYDFLCRFFSETFLFL
jgi:hypothetical protein